jgi:hypothetical protein
MSTGSRSDFAVFASHFSVACLLEIQLVSGAAEHEREFAGEFENVGDWQRRTALAGHLGR